MKRIDSTTPEIRQHARDPNWESMRIHPAESECACHAEHHSCTALMSSTRLQTSSRRPRDGRTSRQRLPIRLLLRSKKSNGHARGLRRSLAREHFAHTCTLSKLARGQLVHTAQQESCPIRLLQLPHGLHHASQQCIAFEHVERRGCSNGRPPTQPMD